MDLVLEVATVVEKHANQIMPKAWLIQAVLLGHPTDDAWFAHCAYIAVDDAVHRYLARVKNVASLDGESDPQLKLPGFQRLQRWYLLKRYDEATLVPIEQMTN